MKTLSKKSLSILLAIVLAFSLAITAFADWTSYQKNNNNNGRITGSSPLKSSLGTLTGTNQKTAQLPYNGTIYSGVDVSPLMFSNYAYVLYNGGTVSGTSGGARLAAYDYTSNLASAFFNIQLDADAVNIQQLATPYIDSTNKVLYAAVTYGTYYLNAASMAGWTQNGSVTIDGSGVATFTGNGSVSTPVTLANATHTLYVPTNLTKTVSGTAHYTIALTGGGNTYTLDNSTLYYSDWGGGTWTTYDGGSAIPSGNYTLTISVDSISNDTVTASTSQVERYDWRLYSVSGIDTASPTRSATWLATGEGQINSHINTAGNNLYFGVSYGDHSYYQYNISTASLTPFKPGTDGDNFYWAGACKVSISGTDYMVFGSDSGTMYVRPVGDNFGNSVYGNSFAATQSSGLIRCSVVESGSSIYYTSKNGYAYKIQTSTITSGTPTITNLALPSGANSTSTPVVSSNGVIYVSYYIAGSYPATGGVVAIKDSTFSSYTTVYSGDSVQGPVIVYTSGNYDYVYFTTNTDAGKGYCYSVLKTNLASSAKWNTATTIGTANYILQGMAASENGYLVFGNDANTLYVIH
jgi:hypothetical protein